MLLLHVHKNAYDTYFQVPLCTCTVLEYLKIDTSKNGIYKLYSLRSSSPSVSLYFCACFVHYIWPSTDSSCLTF